MKLQKIISSTLAVALAAMLSISSVSVQTFAEDIVSAAESETQSPSGEGWSLSAKGTLTLSGNNKISRIPDEYSTKVKKIVMNGENTLNYYAFSKFTNLTSVTFSDSLTTIPDYAFYGCSSLEKITIPSNIKTIGANAFKDCTALTDITLSRGVESLGERCFAQCSSIKSITIPTTVNSIGDIIFEGCTSLSKISVMSSNSVYSSSNGVLYDRNKTTLICYPSAKSGKSFKIPNTVSSICWAAFMYNDYLTSVSIPKSVTSITNALFGYCTKLTKITVASDNPTFSSKDGILYGHISGGWFSKSKDYLICYPAGKTGTSYTIPENYEVLPNAFSGCKKLNKIICAGQLSEGALWGCSSLTTIAFKATGSMEHNSDIFRDCSKLATITVDKNNNTLTAVKNVLYSKDKSELIYCAGASAGKSFTIPGTVLSICSGAFRECSKLQKFAIASDGDNYVAVNGVLYNYDKTELICFPAAKSSKNYSVPKTVITIDDYAFANCKKLSGITLSSDTNICANVRYDNWNGEYNAKATFSFYGVKDGFIINGVNGSSAQTIAVIHGLKFAVA